MLKTSLWIAAVVAALAGAPAALHAHRQWLLPSSTVLSGEGLWVTVDAAVSNELFYFDHVPLRLTNLEITAPDGSKVAPENVATGKYRSTFDVHLTARGTYRIASVSSYAFASWTENGERKSWRGAIEELETAVPKGAADLRTSRMTSRVESFVTAGAPTSESLAPKGVGLELAPITHPNDIYACDPVSFQLLLDGKPAKDLDVTIIRGGIRYRDQLGEIHAKTDAEGKITVRLDEPGMYWLNASTGGGRGPGGPSPDGPGAGAPGGRGPGGGPRGEGGPRSGGPMRMPGGDRASYTATFEALPQ